LYSLQSVRVDRLCALGFPVGLGRHWSSEAKVKICTTPQSKTHTGESSVPRCWSTLFGLQGSVDGTWGDENDTCENKGREGCETGAAECEDDSWEAEGVEADSRLLATTSVSQRKRNTHPALDYVL
jgi:hypothetical protein